jgi:hypothetical protein
MPQEHRCQQQRNTKTTTGNISDAISIINASNSKKAIAGMPIKAVKSAKVWTPATAGNPTREGTSATTESQQQHGIGHQQQQ